MYIDQFFESGRIRLSSFQQFARHPDEERQDPDEGRSVLAGTGYDQTVVMVVRGGSNCLVLSASSLLDDSLAQAFGTDGCFRIKDTTQFGVAIAGRLQGFVQGVEGPCVYLDRKLIQKQLSADAADRLKAQIADGNVQIDQVGAMAAELGDTDALFVKSKRYRHQAEYRFVWTVRHEVDEPVFVDCPEAVQFCDRVA